MKTKTKTIIALSSIFLIVIATSLTIILIGAKNGGFNYIRLEYNPSVEFVTDTFGKVLSYRPLNENARLATIDVEIKGVKIDKAIDNVLEESLKLGFFDLESEDNVMKITTVSGLTQAIDVHVYRAVNQFLLENEILSVIIENANDMEKIKEAKELKTTVHELALIDSISKTTNIEKSSISQKMPDELIDIVMEIDQNYINDNPITDEERTDKKNRIENFEEEYNNHISKISKESKREYKEKQVELNREKQTEYELNFSSVYSGW